MGFKIDQKVVCVNAKMRNFNLLEEGRIYTVSGNKSCCMGNVSLSEFTNPRMTACSECGYVFNGNVNYFKENRFVPLQHWEQAEEAKEELLKSLQHPIEKV